MNARFELDHYLSHARQRLRWILSAQGSALLVAVLLVVTLVAAWMLPRYGFTAGAALAGRIALAVAALGAIGWWVWRWRAQERGRAAAALERALPDQSGRIATYLQESAKEPGKASVLLDLLAADALALAQREPLTQSIRPQRYVLPAAGAVLGVALLGALLFSNIGLGEGARQLWLGRLPPAASVAAAAGGIAVQPGDATIRRNQDLDVAALVAGSNDDVQLHLRFENGDWESAPMERNPDGGYAFTIYAVRDAASYYVTAGPLKSAEHRINVVDLPGIESFKVRYDYPSWTGLDDREEEGGGDVRAVAGTRVNLEVTTTAPLEGPLLVIDGNGQELDQRGTTTRGGFAIKQPGHYRIATRFLGEVVPLTPDYAIEVVEDQKPEIRIVRPGRDYRATAIEEVPVRIEARDDFRLDALELHYSVNGGEWRSERLPAGSDDIQAAALLRLEELQQKGPGGEAPTLVPGDLVSYYAQARDNKHSVQTDLFLIQVQPFEQRFTQSQAGGGGGGGGGEEQEGDISRRQREILLATWNLQRNEKEAGAREKERVADNARMLSEVQQTLAAQARTLIERTQARRLTGQDRNIDQFVRAVQDAAKAMEPAAKNLATMELANAVTHEQQALQHLLRAESAFRDIEVAMQQQGGGGGGGGQAGRDVSEMTELELDLARNQYETESQMSQQQRGQAEDEALRRLRELARRQEQLARQAQRQQIPPEQQRWQQEQLRREAEELRRQLEQLAQQNGQQSQQGQQSSSQQGGQQSQGQQGQQRSASRQQGGQPANERQSQRSASAAEAARQLAEATRQMQAGGDPAAQQRALEQLNRAREQLENARQSAGTEQFSSLADRARQLAERQRQTEEELRAATGGPRPPASIARQGSGNESNNMSFEQMERMAQQKRELASGLEELQRRIDATRREAREDAPQAARQLAEARQELQEMNTVGSLGMSARQIERGRARDAANREPFITDTLDRLARNLESAAQTAAGESGRRQQQAEQASAEDLLAELGDLRRALERAREQNLAQNRSGGDQNTSSPTARDGQQGQQGGGEQGQQGQDGQGQQGQQGGSPGSQGGAQAGADGGAENGRAGAGSNRSGGYARFSGGSDRGPVPSLQSGIGSQAVISAERLAQLREQLRRNGVLSETDARALQDLSNQLRRGGTDPMDVQYQRMAAIVNQLELSALKSVRAANGGDPTRATETVDDSRQYRDNVAEYYRRLGGGND